MAGLFAVSNKARQALAKAEGNPKTTPEQLEALRQTAQTAQAAVDQAQGPPPKPTNVFGGPNVGGDIGQRHTADLEAHQAAVDARIHAEGEAPTPAPQEAGKIFALGNQRINRGTDTAGNSWVGTGHAMVRGDTLEKAAARTAKLKTSTTQTVPSAALDRVVTPSSNVDYQPVTFGRQVTADGKVQVVGQRADGTHLAVQRPVYDALHAAAGPGGSIVMGPWAKKPGTYNSRGDDRVFARNAEGETVGVGMPMRVDEARAKTWMHGPEAAPPAAQMAAATGSVPNYRITKSQTYGKPIWQVVSGRGGNYKTHSPWYYSEAEATAELERLRSGGAPGKVADVAPGGKAPEENLQPQGAVSGPEADLFSPEAAHNQVETGPETGPGTKDLVSDQAPDQAGVAIATEPTAIATQLEKLTATRDALAGKPNPSPQDAIKLKAIEKQIRQLQIRERNAAPAPKPDEAPVTQDTSASPLRVPRGGYTRKDIHYYKFNNGTSVYRSVFEAAGHNPDLAVNKPLAWQARVLSDHLKNQFGFRDVTVQPGTNPMFAVDTMLDLIRAAQDMANSLAMRASLISLDGRLAFSLEPQGARDYLGAYDGGTKTIHLVNDANSFGHEWIHAVDHLLTERLLNNPQHQNLLSRHTRAGELDTSDGTQAAFAKLINTMFYDDGAVALHRINLEQQAGQVNKAGQPTAAAIKAQQNLDALDKGASQQHIQASKFRQMAAQFDPNKAGYWASAHEMLARSGEAYIARQMENNGVDPRGVVMPDEAYLQETDRRLKMTFPKDQERTDIFNAWGDVFDRLRNDGIITGPTAPKADFPAATIGWSQQTTAAARRTSLGEAVRRELNGLSAFLRKARHPIVELSGGELRPKAPAGLPAATRAADKGRTFLYSYGAFMKVIIARNKGPGGRALQAIFDKLSPDPGSGRVVGETFSEDHRAMDNILRGRMAKIFERNGISNPNDMSALDGAMIQHVMTTGNDFYPADPLDLRRNAPGEAIPDNLVRIAGALQDEILKPLYRELTNAGFKVGVAPNGYFPRIYDLHAVYSNPTGFTAAATKLHEVMFDKDVGPPGDNPGRLLERWHTLTKTERAAANNPELTAAMKELGKNLREQAKTKAELQVNPNDATLQAKLAQLEDEARQLAEDNHDLVRDHVALLAASDWLDRIMQGDALEHESLGPSGRFLNRRVLPPEADQIMRDYMHTDPRVAIPRYIDNAARKMAWTRAFGKVGPDGKSKWLADKIKEAQDGGVSGPDLQRFQSLMNQATGRLTFKADRDVTQVTQAMHAMGAIMLMSRSAWSSLAEPLNAAMATKELGAAWKTFANQFGAAMRTASARDRAEIADMIGVTTSSAYDTIMQSRTGADYADSPATDRFMSQFYRATLLTQLTNSQRRAAAGTADWLLRKWAKDLLSTETGNRAADRRADAIKWFNDLGVSSEGNNLRDQFANWMLSHDSPVTPGELGNSEWRGVYGLAVRRLVDRMIQNPYKIDRPVLSGSSVVSLAYQLMSFNYSYQKNILEPMIHAIGHDYQRGYKRGYERAKAGGAGGFGAKARGFAGGMRGGSRTLTAFAVIAATTIFASLLTSLPRQYIFAKDAWDQHEKDGDLGEWLTGLAISRSGIGGTLDPIGQIYNNLRWNSDLSKLFQGAAPSYILQNAMDLIKPFVANAESPNSNVQYHNQARAFYNLIMVPLEVFGLTMMNASGGPGTQAVSSGAMQYLTSPQAADSFASFVAGPKGSTAGEAAGEGDETGGGEAEAGIPALDGEMPDGQPTGPGGAPPASTGVVPLSMMDDIAVPFVRIMSKPWQVLPPIAKMGAAAVAIALYGMHWASETQQYRDNPKSEPE